MTTPVHTRRLAPLLTALAILAPGLGAAGLACAQEAAVAQPQLPSTQPERAAPDGRAGPAPSVAEPAVSAVTQAAVQQGVLTCAARINQVSRFVGFNAQAGALIMGSPAQPDERLVPIVLETPTRDGSAYVSAAFAPKQANGCGATYDAVNYWPGKCEAVAAKAFAGFKAIGKLKQHITVLDGGPATKVFLMPAGTGCVSIKKEVVL